MTDYRSAHASGDEPTAVIPVNEIVTPAPAPEPVTDPLFAARPHAPAPRRPNPLKRVMAVLGLIVLGLLVVIGVFILWLHLVFGSDNQATVKVQAPAVATSSPTPSDSPTPDESAVPSDDPTSSPTADPTDDSDEPAATPTRTTTYTTYKRSTNTVCADQYGSGSHYSRSSQTCIGSDAEALYFDLDTACGGLGQAFSQIGLGNYNWGCKADGRALNLKSLCQTGNGADAWVDKAKGQEDDPVNAWRCYKPSTDGSPHFKLFCNDHLSRSVVASLSSSTVVCSRSE